MTEPTDKSQPAICYASICSGIEAAGTAWQPLGFVPLWLSETEPVPCRVLVQRFPETPNFGDITAPDFVSRAAELGRPDIIVGGTPCQAFSVAGSRRGLADDRGNLSLRFVEICNELNPTVIVWENVPGVLYDDTNAFGCIVAGLVGAESPFRGDGTSWPSCGWASGPCRSLVWRVLNAQYFGVPQRRRRLFVVATARTSGIDPAEILFEREGVRRNPAPGGQAQTHIARAVTASTGGASGKEQQLTFVGADGSAESALNLIPTVIPAVTAKWAKGSGGPSGDECQNLVRQETGVRRLTPRECERLQGFPDDYTLIDGASDSARIRALGNSMAVPVMRWIGERILAVYSQDGRADR